MKSSAEKRKAVLIVALIVCSSTGAHAKPSGPDCKRYDGQIGSAGSGGCSGNRSSKGFLRESNPRRLPVLTTQKTTKANLAKSVLGIVFQTPSLSPSTPQQVKYADNINVSALIARIAWPNLFLMIVLLMMWMRTITIMAKRYRVYRAAGTVSRNYAPRVAQALKNDRLEDAINISADHCQSHLATLVNAALQEFHMLDSTWDISQQEIESSARAIQRAIAIQSVEFKKGLLELATIGSTALMIGLLGLVIGFIQAFHNASFTGSAQIMEVVAAVLNGFLLLALGIAVGVPAKWIFKYYTGRLNFFTLEMDNAASELLDYLMKNKGKS
jgi:biopolymer transport protein ExbB/biopolymer transport protein TolQ